MGGCQDYEGGSIWWYYRFPLEFVVNAYTLLIIGKRGICSCADHGAIPFSALVYPVEMVFGTFSAQCEVPVISYHSWKYLKSEVIDMTPLYSCSVGAVYPGICPERSCCPRPSFLSVTFTSNR